MRRLLVIYNPRSTNYGRVKTEVLAKLAGLKGWQAGKHAIAASSFEENVTAVSKLFRDGDLVVAAGGDATAAITFNAIFKSGKDVVLGVLPYGNFNDLARTLGSKSLNDIIGAQNIVNFYPLDIAVDGKRWRYASCYVTMGMTAESVAIFDEPRIRARMQKGYKSSWRSYLQLAHWYFKNRHTHEFIPEFSVNGVRQPAHTSDYAAVNGRSMSRVMKGGDDYLRPDVFRSETDRLTSFWRLFKLMIKSMLVRVPGSETSGDVLEFVEPARVTLQCEGELQEFKHVHKIEIRKEQNSCLKVVQN